MGEAGKTREICLPGNHGTVPGRSPSARRQAGNSPGADARSKNGPMPGMSASITCFSPRRGVGQCDQVDLDNPARSWAKRTWFPGTTVTAQGVSGSTGSRTSRQSGVSSMCGQVDCAFRRAFQRRGARAPNAGLQLVARSGNSVCLGFYCRPGGCFPARAPAGRERCRGLCAIWPRKDRNRLKDGQPHEKRRSAPEGKPGRVESVGSRYSGFRQHPISESTIVAAAGEASVPSPPRARRM